MQTPSPLYPLTPGQTVWVAGHRGLVGSAVWRLLEAERDVDLVGASSSELDLRDAAATLEWATARRPDVVVLAAAKVGGIVANDSRPVDFLVDNLRIQTSVLEAARVLGVPRVLFLGSSCIYPRDTHQPIAEHQLLTGHLEPTNDAYAIAKISGIVHVQSVRKQYGLPWISIMPTNLYGPGDNFDPEHSHVMPALIRRFHEATEQGAPEVTVWGSGRPRREFLHVDDMARACLHALEHYDDPMHLNIGTGRDVTIAELVDVIVETTGYTGRVVWDSARPDGMMRKVLDVSRLRSSGFEASIDLRDGVRDAYRWFVEHRAEARLSVA